MEKLQRLKELLAEMDRGVVAFSGGCDSTFLLSVAHEVLGDNVVALTAVSPSLAPWEREDASRLAESIGARHLWVNSLEMDNPEYRANPANRCYFCKDELYSIAVDEAQKLELGVVMDGNNFDDIGDHRPGRLAAKEHGVRSPLEEAGFTKEEVRHWSRELGLPTWDKPAIACLASRFPYGTKITRERIQKVTDAEAILREHGFRQYRARFHDTILRIELAPVEFEHMMEDEVRLDVVKRCKALGFLYVALDLQGFRSGSMNEALKSKSS